MPGRITMSTAHALLYLCCMAMMALSATCQQNPSTTPTTTCSFQLQGVTPGVEQRSSFFLHNADLVCSDNQLEVVGHPALDPFADKCACVWIYPMVVSTSSLHNHTEITHTLQQTHSSRCSISPSPQPDPHTRGPVAGTLFWAPLQGVPSLRVHCMVHFIIAYCTPFPAQFVGPGVALLRNSTATFLRVNQSIALVHVGGFLGCMLADVLCHVGIWCV